MLRLLTTLLFVFTLSTSIAAQDGLALLKTGHGARQAGMGETSVAVSNDVNGSNYNPASIRTLTSFTASFGHTVYWENIRFESGFYALPLSDKINLHGGIRFATDDDLEERNYIPSEDPIALFDFHDISFKTGISYKKSEKTSFGIAFGWLYEKNNLWSGASLNFDLGVQHRLSPKLQLGFSVVNLGSDLTLKASGFEDSRPIPLPTKYTAGVSYTYNKYHGVLDLVILDDELKLNLGAETKLHEIFDVRAGYLINYDSKSFTAGASFRKRNLQIDYAFVPYSNNLGSTHLFNFTFRI